MIHHNEMLTLLRLNIHSIWKSFENHAKIDVAVDFSESLEMARRAFKSTNAKKYTNLQDP
jgi:hypothetical protein